MPNGYKNQPISGFTGYIPGAKWQVGSRYVAGSRENSGFSTRNAAMLAGAGGPGQQMQAGNSSAGNVRQKMTPKMLPHVGQTLDLQQRTMGNEQMKNYSEMTNEELRERMMRMQMDMQNLQMAMGMQNGGKETRQALLGQRTPFSVSDGGSEQAIGNYAMRDEPSGRMDRRTEFEGRQGQQDQSLKQRSKSMPRRIENNPFDGIESGWWSKGEVKRNQERRDIANGGQMVSGGNWNQRPPSRQRVSRKLGALEKDDTEDIPTAGYSGHIQGLRQLGVGKSFNTAARQAKKEYIERRRTYSGSRDALNGRGRGTQFSEEELSANAVKLPDNRF